MASRVVLYNNISTGDNLNEVEKIACRGMESNSFTDVQASPRQTSFSTLAMDYSSDNDENSIIMQLPISPVCQSQDEEEEEDNNDSCEHDEGRAEQDTSIVNSSLLESPNEVEVSNELSVSTSQTSHCNEKNSQGQSPLSISSHNCFLDGMKLLIERGANINLQDDFGRTPLHLVCENAANSANDHHDLLDYLLQNGANPCIQDLNGSTPLHIAASKGCVVCINKLMQHKAEPNSRDARGEIALHIATRGMHLECMEALSPSCENSTSNDDSSCSILLQFENDSFYQFAGDRSLARSSQEMASTTVKENDIELWHDSGYFTARGNAWTKSKYYARSKIEEEEEVVGSSVGSSQSALQSESDSLSPQEFAESSGSKWDAAHFFTRLVLCFIDFLLTWMRNQVVKKTTQGHESKGHESNRGRSFIEPPDHIKEAMARFKEKQDTQANYH